MAVTKTIGLLGGSFDPVHRAHIDLADTAWRALELDEVQLVPAADPWQRRPLCATGEQRLAMLDIAIRGRPHLRVNPIEIQRGGKTYTIDTLRQLPGTAAYYWILGADQLQNFCSWHAWREITGLVTLAVAQRPGSPLAVPQALLSELNTRGRSLIELPFEPTPISASQIRHRIAALESTEGLLDVAVAQYIEQNGLYRAPIV